VDRHRSVSTRAGVTDPDVESGRAERHGERMAIASLAVSTMAGLGLAVTYSLGGEPQVEGLLLGLALGGLGIALVVIAHRLLPSRPHTEERTPLTATPAEESGVESDLERVRPITRRRMLLGALAAAGGALGIAALFPVRSLGPGPGRTLAHTPWRAGRRAITEDGSPVRAAQVPVGGLVTIFPEGFPGSADGQVVLVRVAPRDHPSGAAAPHGLLAYSKVCTHAGCPVGLYEPETHQLLCPCHQSAFDVLDGAAPVFGPAARALPRLPIAVDRDGVVVALGDFPEPIGPGYWSRP
jgi:ubiquinol-cytochrome c reductase iron-sulfur subunit